jgi:hypothetical protein
MTVGELGELLADSTPDTVVGVVVLSPSGAVIEVNRRRRRVSGCRGR